MQPLTTKLLLEYSGTRVLPGATKKELKKKSWDRSLQSKTQKLLNSSWLLSNRKSLSLSSNVFELYKSCIFFCRLQNLHSFKSTKQVKLLIISFIPLARLKFRQSGHFGLSPPKNQQCLPLPIGKYSYHIGMKSRVDFGLSK